MMQLTKKRCRNMPIQYVLGEWNFHGHSFFMRQPVFIPRPETEVCILQLRLANFVINTKATVYETGKKSFIMLVFVAGACAARSRALCVSQVRKAFRNRLRIRCYLCNFAICDIKS